MGQQLTVTFKENNTALMASLGWQGLYYHGLIPPHLDWSQNPFPQSLSCIQTEGPQSCWGCLLRLH